MHVPCFLDLSCAALLRSLDGVPLTACSVAVALRNTDAAPELARLLHEAINPPSRVRIDEVPTLVPDVFAAMLLLRAVGK
jgi:hypothetical protein